LGGSLESRAADGPLELVVVAGETLVVAPLPPTGAVVIGRDRSCDVRIESGSVSRRHARLHLGPQLALEDLGSRNGTFVADNTPTPGVTDPLRRLQAERVPLAIGDRVNLGTAVIVVRRGPPSATARDEEIAREPVLVEPAMRELYAQIQRAAHSKITVLLLGETGVGKEVLARELHGASRRAKGPFVALDCASLPSTLAEAQLFGHEKSAFTGADREKAGFFETAHGGTLFLDEVGELSLDLQTRFLRVLEEGAVVRVGGRTPRAVDVRIVAATNRDLHAEAARGAFRLDLLHRLDSLSLEIPPLRRRPLEVQPLAERFVLRFARQLDRDPPPSLSAEALECLRAHTWPGNVRELRNAMERAVTLCQGPKILSMDLPPRVSLQPAGSRLETPPRPSERLRILTALEECAGNQTRAAERLGMSLRTLVSRLDEYGLPRPRKRNGLR
jgi:DNA-binding NtrC family response regulator